MEERKRCTTCHTYLIASNGLYMHPETVCNGIMDYIDITARIDDSFMHEKFVKLYGKPKINDYERLELLEKELRYKESILAHPVIKFILRIFKKIQ